MSSSSEATDIFGDSNLLYGPSTAANAGGVAVCCIEMAQNRMMLNWPAEEVDSRLKFIMKNIHQKCLDTASEFGHPGNYLMGANIAGFLRIVDAMVDQGVA
jgi:glutamate dehydrogenase (NADP+)